LADPDLTGTVLLVFRTFFHPFRYSCDIWYIALPYPLTDQVRVWVSIHWFFKKLWLLELGKNHELSVFSTYFLSAYRYLFDIYCTTLLCHTKLQTKFEFGYGPLIFHEVIILGLRKKVISFPRLFSPLLTNIYLIFSTLLWQLPYQVTDQVRVWFLSIDFSRSYDSWKCGKNHELSVFSTFFSLCLQIFIWYILYYIAMPYQVTDQVRVWLWSIDFSRSYNPWT
jgi:hypothetical protein